MVSLKCLTYPLQMPFTLNSTSTGEVFVSTYKAIIESRTVPTTQFQLSHPFHAFWKEHIKALTRPGLYDNVIDALVALAEGDPSWRREAVSNTIVKKRGTIRELLRSNPPNLVVVSGVDAYSFHLREKSFWPFIYISEEYVNLWTDADRSSEQGLALTALLGAAIDHEIGHWVFTLKAGLFSPEYCQANEINERKEVLEQFSKDQLEDNNKKNTPKKLGRGAGWKANSGEAGDFVECRSRGGILIYSQVAYTQAGKAYLQTGERVEDIHYLPLSYLQNYREDSPIAFRSLRFIVPPSPGSAAKMKTQSQHDIFFPRTADDSAQPSSSVAHVSRLQVGQCELRVRSAMFVRELLQRRGVST